jgi:hypothetical protein
MQLPVPWMCVQGFSAAFGLCLQHPLAVQSAAAQLLWLLTNLKMELSLCNPAFPGDPLLQMYNIMCTQYTQLNE